MSDSITPSLDQSNETQPEENFSELFQKTLLATDVCPGMTISVTVVQVDSNYVTVDAGLKSDAVIPREEFADEPVSVGDKVEVVVESLEDGFGNARVSRERARSNEAWGALHQAFEAREPVVGLITDRVKGGYTVFVHRLRAFLPGSLIDTRGTKDVAPLEGKELEFKIIKIDQKRGNVVLSRRAMLENEVSQEEREQLLNSLFEGKEIAGVVKNITDYGAFIDLGGIDGLLHVTDMSWRRIRHPSEILSVGDAVQVRVLKYDAEKKRVSLGLKQMGEDPWKDVSRRYPPKTRLFGQVTNLVDYGCFVQLEEGIEGLVHVSEMDWTNKNVHPSKILKLGDEVEVMVLSVHEEKRRISLGMKQCLANPWEDFVKSHNKGDTVSGKIRSITDFGLFIGLDGGIDGLVHLSDLSWRGTGEALLRQYKKGGEVQAVVVAMDPNRERISLGIKQLESDPFARYLEMYPKGTLVQATVLSMGDKYISLALELDLKGQVRVAECRDSELKEGEKLAAYLVGLDRKTNVFNLTTKVPKSVESKAATQETASRKSKKAKAAPVKSEGARQVLNTTLGDLLREHIGNKNKED